MILFSAWIVLLLIVSFTSYKFLQAKLTHNSKEGNEITKWDTWANEIEVCVLNNCGGNYFHNPGQL